MTGTHLASAESALLKIKSDLAAVEVLRALQRLSAACDGMKYDPSQPRVPAGNSGGGQWTDGGGGASSSGSNRARSPRSNINDYLPDVTSPDYSDAITPVYPVEIALAYVVGRPAFVVARTALGAVSSAARAVFQSRRRSINHTAHGSLRTGQRNITEKQIQEAIRTAQKTGNVSTDIGKYRTPQIIYKGSNGVTVIVETAGRNAGKIITLYRH
jgi:hypothetical protein